MYVHIHMYYIYYILCVNIYKVYLLDTLDILQSDGLECTFKKKEN